MTPVEAMKRAALYLQEYADSLFASHSIGGVLPAREEHVARWIAELRDVAMELREFARAVANPIHVKRGKR